MVPIATVHESGRGTLQPGHSRRTPTATAPERTLTARQRGRFSNVRPSARAPVRSSQQRKSPACRLGSSSMKFVVERQVACAATWTAATPSQPPDHARRAADQQDGEAGSHRHQLPAPRQGRDLAPASSAGISISMSSTPSTAFRLTESASWRCRLSGRKRKTYPSF
jgi:hypothetical protein